MIFFSTTFITWFGIKGHVVAPTNSRRIFVDFVVGPKKDELTRFPCKIFFLTDPEFVKCSRTNLLSSNQLPILTELSYFRSIFHPGSSKLVLRSARSSL